VPYVGTLRGYLCINKTGKQLNTNIMNTDNTLSIISSMVSSEASYTAIVDMINDMELELMDVCMA